MDRYQRVEKAKGENSQGTPINENEIRITTLGRMRNYITYATTLFQEKGSDEIVLKAMGRAINKTVMIAELIKRRIADLHQNTAIGSNDITDTWEPLEEGLLPVQTTRHVSMITITLSKKELNTTSTGYQPPIPADQVRPSNEVDHEEEGSPTSRGRGRGGRGRGRGRGRGNYAGPGDFYGGRGYGGRGRGRGRSGNFRGRGRGYEQGSGGRGYEQGSGGRGYEQGSGGRGYEQGSGGRGYEQGSGGYYDYGEAPPAPGRGRGRGRGGRGRGRGRGGRGEGPAQAAGDFS